MKERKADLRLSLLSEGRFTDDAEVEPLEWDATYGLDTWPTERELIGG